MARRPKRNYVEAAMVQNLDHLARFEEFKATIAPALQQDLREGKSAEEILKKYQAIVAARLITAAMLEMDHGKAAAAAEKVLDRGMGKPVQKQEIEGRFTNMSDTELDSMLTSALNDSGTEEDDDASAESH